MKKDRLNTALFLLIILYSASLFAQNKATCKINIFLKNAGNKVIYLSNDVYVPNTKKIILDSAAFRNDSLDFNVKDIRPGFYTLFFKNDKKFLPVFLDGSDIKITGDADLIYRSRITGSTQMNIWFAFETALKMDKQHEEYLFRRLTNADGNKQADSVRFYKLKLDSVHSVLYKRVDSLFELYPRSFATIKYLDAYDKMILPDAKELALLDRMPDAYKGTDDYLNLKNKIQARTTFAVGNKFKDFELPDTNNRMVSTQNHNRYLLVDFWASWCVPCRKANPTLKKLYDAYQSKGLAMISVSIDDNKTAWRKAIKDDHLNWKQLIAIKGANEPEISAFAISVVPTTYLVDDKGTIIAKNLPVQELEEKVEALFKE